MKLKECLKKIYNKEYLILLGIGFLPLLWKILEISFLTPFQNALKILSQIALINIIFKIFEESILNPLFKTLSKENYNTHEEKYCVAKKFLIFYSLTTILFSIICFLLSKQILKISKIPEYIFDDTLCFVKIYIIASSVGIIVKYLFTFNLINKDTKKMFIYFILKSIATAILFIIIVPKFSLGLGVNGIAIAELVINIITLIYLLFTFPKVSKSKIKLNVKQYLKLLIFAFIETMLRNIIYYFVILVLLNTLDNQDLYFVSNEFIWSIMLIPTIAQSSLIKQEVSNNTKTNLKPYFINSILLNSFIILLIPIAFLVFKYIYGLPNYLQFFIVLLKLLPCYTIFIIDSIIEAYFISSGKLNHILIQSFITNILVYLTALILYLLNIWTVTLNSIILLFNLGVIISSIYTITIYIIEKRKTYSKN